jgi:hypothetical protein
MLNELIEKGDYTRIARIFNERHKQERDTITSAYVSMILRGTVVTTSSKAKEVIEIATSYINCKEAINQNLVTV